MTWSQKIEISHGVYIYDVLNSMSLSGVMSKTQARGMKLILDFKIKSSKTHHNHTHYLDNKLDKIN